MLNQYSLIMSGAAQRLSSVLSPTTPGGNADLTIRILTLQHDPANANVINVGSSAVSASAWAIQLPAPVASVAAAPYIFEFGYGGIRLSELYVFGAAGTLHIGTVPL